MQLMAGTQFELDPRMRARRVELRYLTISMADSPQSRQLLSREELQVQ